MFAYHMTVDISVVFRGVVANFTGIDAGMTPFVVGQVLLK